MGTDFDPRQQLSEHFAAWEIFGWHPNPTPTALEIYLATSLCEERLELLRDVVGAPLRVTPGGGGRRTLHGHHALAQNGKKPSITSDHSYGPGFVDLTGAYRLLDGSKPFYGTGAAAPSP